MQMNELEAESRSFKVRRCPECGSFLLRDPEYAEIVCQDCGFVVTSKLVDRGPEWRAFDHEQLAKRTRVGAPLTYTIHDKGLSTKIDWRDRDVYGRRLSQDQRAQVHRLRKWQRRIRVSGSQERNLSSALSLMSRMADILNLPKNILETASVIYRKVLKRHLIKGRKMQAMVAATLYIGCRQCGLVRRLWEVAQAAGVDKKALGRSYRFIVKKLNLFMRPVKARRYVARFTNELTMQGRVEGMAHQILRVVEKLRLASGRGPAGIAGAASYIASTLIGERRTQREIAEAVEVTEVTVRTRYKEIIERLLIVVSL